MAVFCGFHQDISTMTDTSPTQDTPPSSSKRRGRHCAAFSCANSYYDAKGNATGLHFFSFPKDVQRRNRWCNLIKRQHGKDGFFVTKSTFLCSEHFRKEDIRKTLAGRWELVKGLKCLYRCFVVTWIPKESACSDFWSCSVDSVHFSS